MNYVIILSAGKGLRFGEEKPKQYIDVNGKPVIWYTLQRMQKNKHVDEVVLVVEEEYKEYVKALAENSNFSKVKWIVRGGDTFQQSVMEGIKAVEKQCKKDDNIMIQCAVSPNTSDCIIEDSFVTASKNGNAIAGDEVIFPVCVKNDEGIGIRQIKRENVVLMNGPWTFRANELIELYKKAFEEGVLDKVESHTTSLMLYYEMPIYFSKSERTNIKITNKEDLELFKAMLAIKEKTIDE